MCACVCFVSCSVTKQEVCDAIYQQTGRNLVDMEMEMPEIKALGTFECSVKLVRPQHSTDRHDAAQQCIAWHQQGSMRLFWDSLQE